MWDSATGTRLPGASIPPLAPNGNTTPDGQYQFVPDGTSVLKVPTRIDEGERLWHLWLTQPDPDWHIQRQKELTAEGNTYGAAVHRAFEQHARGVLAFEAGDFDRAWGYLIAAAALKPAIPTLPAILPPPPATIPRVQ